MKFQSQGDASRAYEALAQAIAADQGWTDPETRFRAWRGWGVWLREQHRDVEAENALQTAIALYPSQAQLQPVPSETYRFLGLSQWAQNSLEEAVQSLKMAVHIERAKRVGLHSLRQSSVFAGPTLRVRN